jgi:lipid II:glycine glycyltransferase (peptidoglycan interpeptide bridge formation enzyme)
LGISNENNGKDLNIGLLNWKQGFGSEIFQNDFHIIDTNNYFLLENKN